MKVEIDLPDINSGRDCRKPMTARLFLAMLIDGGREELLDAPLSVLVMDGNSNSEVCMVPNDWPRRESDRVWLTAFASEKRLVRRSGR